MNVFDRRGVRYQGIVVLAALAAWMGGLAPASGQNPKQSVPADSPLRQAYTATQSARTEDDFTAVIELCQRGLEGAKEQERNYGNQLLAWALTRRAELRSDANREEEAVADFSRAIELDAARWRAIHGRGISHARLGHAADALADFDRTIELKPDHASAWFNRGELYYDRSEWARAIGDYDEAIRLRPKDAAAYGSRGHAHYMQGSADQALKDYDRALALDPRAAEIMVYRADLLADRGNFERASRDYRTALRVDPSLGRAYVSAAWLMATCPDARFRATDLALQAAQRAIELDGDEDCRYLETLAAAHANAGQFDEAVQVQTKAVELGKQALGEEEVAPLVERLQRYQADQPYRDVLKKDKAGTGTGKTNEKRGTGGTRGTDGTPRTK